MPPPTTNRVLLVLTLPARLRHRFLALHQERQALVLRKQRLALAPILLVFLGYGRVAEDLGFGKAFDQSANWIVQVPPGHDHQEAGRVAEASKEIIREPVPKSCRELACCSPRPLPLTGSSTMPRSKPLPVIWPSTVVLRNEPRGHVLQHITVSNASAIRCRRDEFQRWKRSARWS